MASVDYLETVSWDGALPQVKKKFYQVILEALETGPMTREELVIQVVSVSNDDDGWIIKLPYKTCCVKDHGEAFP